MINNDIIFNSKDNYSKNLKIHFSELQEEYLFDEITIIKNKEYAEVTACTNDIHIIETLDTLLSDFKEKEITVYPNESTEIYFKLTLINKIHIIKNIINKKIIKFYCSPDIMLLYNENKYDNFNDNYSNIANDIYLTESIKTKIQKVLENQNKEHWFNDQNEIVEREYKRILNLLNTKKIQDKKEIFNPSVLKVINGSIEPMSDLDKIIGLESIKTEVKKISSAIEYKNKRQDKELINNKDTMHMCFYGNPGTGKTIIARIMTGILFDMGYIKENKCIEINGLELKGANIGQASTITKGIINFSRGGVLFIDEAYTLLDYNEQDFGKEVVNTLIKEMEDNRSELVIIFAGYTEPMNKLLDSNSGFRSRIKKFFNFEDYNTDELFDIFIKLFRNKHLYIDKDALEKIAYIIQNEKNKQNFGNGRFIDNFINHIEETHIFNVKDSDDYKRIDTITIEDITQMQKL